MQVINLTLNAMSKPNLSWIKTRTDPFTWPLYEGSFQYNITNMWTILGSMQTNVLGVFPDEAKLLDANGDFSVTKYGQTIFRNLYSNESYSPTSSQ